MIWFHTDSGSLFRFPHHCGIGVGRFSSIYNTSTSRFLRLQPRYTLATKSTVAKAGDKSATKSTVDFTPICRRFVESLPQLQGHAILWHRISQKRYEIQTYFQWNTNRDLHMPFSTMSFRMTLSDLEWLIKIFDDMKCRAVSATAELFVYNSIALTVDNVTWTV